MTSQPPKKLKIGIVAFPSYGGSGAVATELGKRLATRGHKVHFITTDVPFRLIGPWRRNVFFHQVELLEYPVLKASPITLTLANKIFEVATQEKLDIVHVHYAVPHLPAALLAQQMANRAFRVLCTLHGTDVTITGVNPIVKDVMSYSLSHVDGITTVARQLAEEAQTVFGLKGTPRVIYNFVEVEQYAKDKATELKTVFANNDQKLIIHVSNFRSVKRVEDVIRIFHGIRKHVASKLLLVGDGPDQRVAYKLAAKLNIVPDLHFMGLQSQVSRLLAIADLFLLPSEREGLSLAALEAMTMGVPVVATEVGGMPELIQTGENGFLAPVGDTELMAKYATQVLKDSELRARISTAAQATANGIFHPDTIVPQYETAYYDALK